MQPNRRDFIKASGGVLAASGLAAADPGPLPTRPLGKTGLVVPILGFGSGSRFLMYETEAKALEALDRAADRGITYLDTAHGYGNGKSEERIGRWIQGRRDRFILATKIAARTADEARRQIESSLRRLGTDRLDVIQIHALASEADLAAIERPDGVLKAFYEARDRKLTRAIGITSHADPMALKLALERHDFDCTQMALNAAMIGMADLPAGLKATRMARGGFEELALPVAVRKGMGVIAMKVFGQDQIRGAARPEQLLAYALSLPISLASCGMPKLDQIDRNAAVARRFRPMTDVEKKELIDSIAEDQKVGLRGYLSDHRDA